MLIIDERSRNVYENKQKDDTFTEIKSDISTQLKDILCRRTHVLQKSSALLSRFARWERYPSLPFVEAPVTCRMPPGVACPVALAARRERVSGRKKVQVPFLFLTNDPQNAITQIELPNGQFYRTRRQTPRYTCFEVCRKSQITNRKSQMPQWPDDSMTRFRPSTNPLTAPRNTLYPCHTFRIKFRRESESAGANHVETREHCALRCGFSFCLARGERRLTIFTAPRGIVPEAVRQGKLGSCYFHAVIAALAQRRERYHSQDD